MKAPTVTTKEQPETGEDFKNLAASLVIQIAAKAARKGFRDTADFLLTYADKMKP